MINVIGYRSQLKLQEKQFYTLSSLRQNFISFAYTIIYVQSNVTGINILFYSFRVDKKVVSMYRAKLLKILIIWNSTGVTDIIPRVRTFSVQDRVE